MNLISPLVNVLEGGRQNEVIVRQYGRRNEESLDDEVWEYLKK